MRRSTACTIAVLIAVVGCSDPLTEKDGAIVFHNSSGPSAAHCWLDQDMATFSGYVGRLSPGEEFTVRDVPPGQHNLKAYRTYEGGGLCGERDINLKSGETYVWHFSTSL